MQSANLQENKNLVFVIDDEPAAQVFVQSALVARGFEVACFGVAKIALEAFDMRAPAVIFLDVALAQSDAIDVLNGLGERRYAGVVRLMSGGRPQLVAGVQRLGSRQGIKFASALAKPISQDDLDRAIAEHGLGRDAMRP